MVKTGKGYSSDFPVSFSGNNSGRLLVFLSEQDRGNNEDQDCGKEHEICPERLVGGFTVIHACSKKHDDPAGKDCTSSCGYDCITYLYGIPAGSA
jgi:hypothetical protein